MLVYAQTLSEWVCCEGVRVIFMFVCALLIAVHINFWLHFSHNIIAEIIQMLHFQLLLVASSAAIYQTKKLGNCVYPRGIRHILDLSCGCACV